MMEELKPCPFCGTIPKVIEDISFHDYFVSCYNKKCPLDAVYTDDYKSKKQAIKAWNTRSQEWQELDEQKLHGFLHTRALNDEDTSIEGTAKAICSTFAIKKDVCECKDWEEKPGSKWQYCPLCGGKIKGA